VWLMQPEVQTTTRGFLAVSAGALDSDRYSRLLRSDITLPFLPFSSGTKRTINDLRDAFGFTVFDVSRSYLKMPSTKVGRYK